MRTVFLCLLGASVIGAQITQYPTPSAGSVSGSSGTPGGTNGQIQYNANGVFGGLALGNTLTSANGILSTTQPPDRTVTTATDTITSSDGGSVVLYNRSTPVAVSLAAASSNGLGQGWAVTLNNIGAGTVTVTPTGSTINSTTSLQIPQNTGCLIRSNGTNYLPDLSACTALNGGGSMVYPAAGLGVSSGSSWITPTYTNVTSLFNSGSCGAAYLKGDGTCDTPAGGSGSGLTAANASQYFFLPFMSFPQTTASSVIDGIANQVRYVLFTPTIPYAVSRATINVTTLDAATVADIAIYNAAGTTRLWHWGSGSGASTAAIGRVSQTNTTVSLSAGTTYMLAWTDGGATAAAIMYSTGSSVPLMLAATLTSPAMGTCANNATSGVLPSTCGTLTAATTGFNVPVVMFEP